MKTMNCIECPNGCLLQVEMGEDGKIRVSGNRCSRGVTFAESELTNPMRTIATTVRTNDERVRVLPVRVSGPIPRGKIFDVIKAINEITLASPVGRGDTVIENVLGLGVDVISESDILAH